jgi:hypothetical protein
MTLYVASGDAPVLVAPQPRCGLRLSTSHRETSSNPFIRKPGRFAGGQARTLTPRLSNRKSVLRPKSPKLHPRNPGRNVIVGDEYGAFFSWPSTPNVFDRGGGGRPPGNYRDFQSFLRLGQTFAWIHV